MHNSNETRRALNKDDDKVAPILFAMNGWGNRPIAAERARHIANHCHATLKVLRVLSAYEASVSGSRGRGVHADARDERLEYGDFLQCTAHYASDIQAALIVVASSASPPGTCAANELACASHRPVLVLRPKTSSDIVVAASDLKDPEFPVLHAAVELIPKHSQVLAIHNVDMLSLLTSTDFDWVHTMLNADVLHDERLHALECATASLPTPINHVVVREDDTATGIISVSQGCDADVLVIGTRHRTRGVAAVIDQRSNRSLLIVPHSAPLQGTS